MTATENKALDVMDQEEKEFITALISLAKDMPKESRAPFLWVGKGLSLASSERKVFGSV